MSTLSVHFLQCTAFHGLRPAWLAQSSARKIVFPISRCDHIHIWMYGWAEQAVETVCNICYSIKQVCSNWPRA